MDKKGFEKINEILSFEIIDLKSAVISSNTEKFIQKIPALLEKPDDQLKDNIRYLFYLLSNICWTKGIYFSSLQRINKSQGTQEAFPKICIPVFDISELTFKQIQELTRVVQNKNAEKNSLAAFSLDFASLGEVDLLVQLSKIASAALQHEYQGPLFLQANQLRFDGLRFENDRENLLEELKSKTKQAIRMGIFNINFDASQLVDMDALHISEKMLMNLKMVALATNLWVRNFQPNDVVVSVNGKMDLSDGFLPDKEDVKEFLQRLLKEGSRLRFGVTGEDISKIEIPATKIDQESVDQINQLNEVVRRDIKMGGVVIDAGSLKDMNAYLPFSDLRICELKMKLEKGLITEDNISTILKKCGCFEVALNINDYAMRMNQFPKSAEF
jgi:hypothetical protein